jgi:RNA polymerase sigma-70 factor (ECF subfamily)
MCRVSAETTTTPPDADSAQLYFDCQSKDRQVQATAYTKLWSYLARVVFNMVDDQPDAQALTEEYTQRALIRIYEQIGQCREPVKFIAWAKKIAKNIAINDLRRRQRLVPLDSDEWELSSPDDPAQRLYSEQLFALIAQAPISASSRRLVIGRYLDDHPDDRLAQEESRLSGRLMSPSHVQVIRAKDIAKLRNWEPLRTYIDVETNK